MLWKLNEAKIFQKMFHDLFERGVRVETKWYITFFREQVKLPVSPKKEVEKPQVLVFEPVFFTNNGRVSTLLRIG